MRSLLKKKSSLGPAPAAVAAAAAIQPPPPPSAPAAAAPAPVAVPAAVPPPVVREPSPEIIRQVEEEFPEEDSALKREHFERQYAGFAPAAVYAAFADYVWRTNAGVGQVEILQDDGKAGKGELVAGMKKRNVGGFEEEVLKVVPHKQVEIRITDGTDGGLAFKARVLFKPEEDASCRVIWTIWWTPDTMMAGMMYTLMLKGFCNLALYRLEQHLNNQEPAAVALAGEDDDEEDEQPVTAATATTEDEEAVDDAPAAAADAVAGGPLKLQWAARMQTGYEGNLTADQEAALRQLQHELETTDADTWRLAQQHPDGPTRIMLRFLRAECSGKQRKFNVAVSKKRLAATLKYRQDVGADGMLAKAPEKFDVFTQQGNELELEDKEGRLVVFSRVGLMSTCLDIKQLTDEQWRLGLTCVSERRMQLLRESSQRRGYEVSAQVVVYDVRGIGLSSTRAMPLVKLVAQVANLHYAELADIIVVCFAPAMFSSLFGTIKTFLDPVTASKVKVFGTSKSEIAKMTAYMRSVMDPAVLPREYGGESSVEVGYPIAYKGKKYAVE